MESKALIHSSVAPRCLRTARQGRSIPLKKSSRLEFNLGLAAITGVSQTVDTDEFALGALNAVAAARFVLHGFGHLNLGCDPGFVLGRGLTVQAMVLDTLTGHRSPTPKAQRRSERSPGSPTVAGSIDIGRPSRAFPAHTTVRTGPYTAVRLTLRFRLRLELSRDEPAGTLHDPLPRRQTLHIDVAVIGISKKPMSAPLLLALSFILPPRPDTVRAFSEVSHSGVSAARFLRRLRPRRVQPCRSAAER